MNIKLLKRVRDRIAARPRQFLMSALFDKKTESHEAASHCGTACCIAGWAYVLKNRTIPANAEEIGMRYMDFNDEYVAAWMEATEALGLNNKQAERLFTVHSWPQPFKRQFITATKAKDHAAIAIRRINHFIRTKGKA